VHSFPLILYLEYNEMILEEFKRFILIEGSLTFFVNISVQPLDDNTDFLIFLRIFDYLIPSGKH